MRGKTAAEGAAAPAAAEEEKHSGKHRKQHLQQQQQQQQQHRRHNKPDQLPKQQQAVVDTLKTNKAAKAADKKKADKTRKQKLEKILHEVLTLMNTEGPGLYLYDIRDALTQKKILDRCKITLGGLLGAGGTAVVLRVLVDDETDAAVLGWNEFALAVVLRVLVDDETDAAVLGWNEFALKMPYYSFGEPVEITKQLRRLVLEDMKLMLDSEVEPLRRAAAAAAAAAGAAGGGGSRGSRRGGEAPTARKLVHENRWVLPIFTAMLGDPDETLFQHQDTLFLNSVLLAEVMAGDGADLLHESPYGHAVDRMPIESRLFVCGQVIETVAKLHASGVCHADVKPENFLIAKDGTVHLADFGMAGNIGERRNCTEKITLLFMDPTHASCFVRGGHTTLNEKYDAWSNRTFVRSVCRDPGRK
ncbi:Rhoptry kinase family protein ROP30, putative [Eimeria mitis]|uniref:Rhoptry kinase family protein ROP30, putative n=1 Tax=Eimeria mitis TaxID=44415 RepID=U6K9L6_9EIME|nr:Rhoptry kinase family protein ROP30, putative [Eimeria mitis]CDJ32877.1 Rhoptry kinase family protein ROP30, putative [Eimeria mitis]